MRSGCIDHGQQGFGMGYTNAYYRDKQGNYRTTGMHRVVYCKHHGLCLEDIKGKVVRHTCDNARCINPEHLIIGSQYDNVQDMKKRGRAPIHEKHGMCKLKPEEVEAIRKRYAEGGISQRELGKLYGIAQSQVSNIVRLQQWQRS